MNEFFEKPDAFADPLELQGLQMSKALLHACSGHLELYFQASERGRKGQTSISKNQPRFKVGTWKNNLPPLPRKMNPHRQCIYYDLELIALEDTQDGNFASLYSL